MDLDDFGLLSIFIIVPYAVALQILLITFISKYVNARREINRIKQDIQNEHAVAAGRVYHAETHVPAAPAAPAAPEVQNAPVFRPVPQTVQVSAVQSQVMPQAEPSPVQKKRTKISSTSITFGVGVLLLTIVGASFLSVSWSFMRDAMRALTLFAAVAVVYFLSFLSGKVLKLKQTGFAFYTLASFLGPIVIVGVGMFTLFGKGFSYRFGTGWIVSAVAAGVMVLSAALGKLIYKSHFYTGITYFSFSWLIVFIAGQIGEYSNRCYPLEAIFIAVAVLAIILRVIAMLSKDNVKLSFAIYAEVIAYAAPLMMLIAILAEQDFDSVYILAGSILTNIELILHAKFSPKREWLKYVIPLAFFGIYGCLAMDIKYPQQIWPLFVMFIALFLVYFFLKINTLVSEMLFTVFFAFTVLIYDVAGPMRFWPVAAAMGISCIASSVSAYFAKNKARGGINAFMASSWFFFMSLALLAGLMGGKSYENYFIYVIPAPLVAAFVMNLIRRLVNDDQRLRIAAENLIWTALFQGTLALGAAEEYWSTVTIENTLVRLWANGILLFLAGVLLGYTYYLNAKKKDGLSISSLIMTAVALNAPLYLALIPAIWGDLPRAEVKHGYQIAYCVMCSVMAGVLILIRFVPKFSQGKNALYSKPLKHIVSGLLVFWAIAEAFVWENTWMLCLLLLVLPVLYFCGNRFFALIPMVLFESALGEFLTDIVKIQDKNLYNFVFIILILAQFGLGRLFFSKRVFSSKGIDYLAFVPLVLLFGLKSADYNSMIIFLTIALMIFNFIGRTKTPAKIVGTIASVPVVIAVINQPFIELSDVYMLEIYLAVIILDAAIIRFLVKPADEKVQKYCWFALISASVIIEGISAAATEETFDLIVTGVAAVAIFLFSFIQKSRLWFILGVVSIIGIAIYLSATFWSSMAWLLYLLIAGIIMIVIAAGNEWRKRHSGDGKRLFKEWKW
ncbi:MAG: hypothetical protein E7386_07500 [Ruminococcaceae bacterium]|nr:hypothetical protein [Oscillospiraceae bacterium]